MDEQILLERIQRIEESIKLIENSNHRQEAMLRTVIRDLNYIPNETKPNLSIIKPTH